MTLCNTNKITRDWPSCLLEVSTKDDELVRLNLKIALILFFISSTQSCRFRDLLFSTAQTRNVTCMQTQWTFMRRNIAGLLNPNDFSCVFSFSQLFSFQTKNCPTMYKDMFYKANKWTVDSTMSMRSGRDRNMAEIDAVFTSVYKT